MLEKLFFCRSFVLTAACLLSIGLLTNCAKSSKANSTAPNETIEFVEKTDSPKTNDDDGDEKNLPVNLSKIPTVTYCDLIKNAAAYDKKIVRVRAIYLNEF